MILQSVLFGRRPKTAFVIVLAVVLIASQQSALAQSTMPPAAAQKPSLHTSGQHEIKLAPQKLRLTLTMRAEALDAKSAIRSLADHKTKVKTELLALKAEEASISFGATRLTSGLAGVPPEAARYGQQMIMQMIESNGAMAGMRGGGAAKPPELPTVYQATSTVRAEWALPTTDLDALALLPETLKEQIKQRDLVGEKNKAKFEAAMQERMEEIQTAMRDRFGGMSSEGEASPFVIAFVGKADEATRQAATKAAFEQASSQAEALAKVTSFKKGPVISLTYNASAVPNFEEPSTNYAMYAAAMASRQMATLNEDEAAGASPDDLKLVVRVDVQFALE